MPDSDQGAWPHRGVFHIAAILCGAAVLMQFAWRGETILDRVPAQQVSAPFNLKERRNVVVQVRSAKDDVIHGALVDARTGSPRAFVIHAKAGEQAVAYLPAPSSAGEHLLRVQEPSPTTTLSVVQGQPNRHVLNAFLIVNAAWVFIMMLNWAGFEAQRRRQHHA